MNEYVKELKSSAPRVSFGRHHTLFPDALSSYFYSFFLIFLTLILILKSISFLYFELFWLCFNDNLYDFIYMKYPE